MAKKQEREIERWVTVKGARVPIYSGQSVDDAIKERQIAQNKKQADEKNKSDRAVNKSKRSKKVESSQDVGDRLREKYGRKPVGYEDSILYLNTKGAELSIYHTIKGTSTTMYSKYDDDFPITLISSNNAKLTTYLLENGFEKVDGGSRGEVIYRRRK